MTQEDKELLKKDLCARLPYRVKVYNTTFKEPTIQTLYCKISDDEFLMEETYTGVGVDGDDFGSFNKRHYTGYVDFIKPYLRPISSMTEEEKNEYRNIDNRSYSCPMDYAHIPASDRIDWLNAHHIDFRGLIQKGLAIETTKEMYEEGKI